MTLYQRKVPIQDGKESTSILPRFKKAAFMLSPPPPLPLGGIRTKETY